VKKSQLIYQFIRTKKAVSKQDIVIDLRLSLPTITQNLQYLEQQRLIDSSKKIPSTGERGRNATAYTYLKEARCAIGMYLTAHHINVVAVDLSGDVIYMVRENVEFDWKNDAYLRKIGEIAERVKDEAGISDENFLGVGIAVPGIVSEDGERVKYGVTLDFTGWTRAEIAKYIPYETKLFHDSSTAGYAEVWISDDICDAFYISLNNSVGGAFVINKSIYEGEGRRSAEIGHMTVVTEDGEVCYCGKRGCFDTLARATNLDQYTDGNLERFFELLKAKDVKAMELWDKYLDDLSLGIHNISTLFDSSIIIGGYVGAYIEDYMDDLCRRVDVRDTFGEQSKTYLIPCKYKVESAAAGAAIWFIDEFFETI